MSLDEFDDEFDDGRRGRIALICRTDRGFDALKITYWASIDEALDAAIAFPKCRPSCVGDHDIVAKTICGRIRTLRAGPAIVRRDISRAWTGDQAAIDRLRNSLKTEGATDE